MGLVEGPAFALRASGKVGPIVYAKHKGGTIAKIYTKPIQPGSGKQLLRRASFAAVVAGWQSTLTSSQRNEWERKAGKMRFLDRLSQYYTPSTYGAFMKFNLITQLFFTSINYDPPIFGVPVAPWYVDVFFNVITGKVEVSFLISPGVLIDTDGMIIQVAGPFDSPNRSAQTNEYSWLQRFVPPNVLEWSGFQSGKSYWFGGYGANDNGERTAFQEAHFTAP